MYTTHDRPMYTGHDRSVYATHDRVDVGQPFASC
jgi:hypothetical protein